MLDMSSFFGCFTIGEWTLVTQVLALYYMAASFSHGTIHTTN